MLSIAASYGNAIAMAVGGIVAVIVISAVFYVIGRGEDRDRATPGAGPADPAAAASTVAPAEEERDDVAKPAPADPRRPATPSRLPRRRRP